MKPPEPTYNDLTPAQQVDLRKRIYYFLADGPRYFATVRNKFALSDAQTQGALDALSASGGVELQEVLSGEKIGRWAVRGRK